MWVPVGSGVFSQTLYENRTGNGTHTRSINNFGTRMGICCDRYYEDLLGSGNPYIFGSLVSSVVSWFIEKTMYMYVPEHKSVFAMLGMMLHITRNLIIRVNPQHNLVRLSVNSMMFSWEFASRFWYKWLLQWKNTNIMMEKFEISAFQNIKNYWNRPNELRERAHQSWELNDTLFGAVHPRILLRLNVDFLSKILKFQSNVTFSLLDRF